MSDRDCLGTKNVSSAIMSHPHPPTHFTLTRPHTHSAYYYLPVLMSVAALFLPGGTSSKSKDISEKRPSIDKTGNGSVELSPAVGDVSAN